MVPYFLPYPNSAPLNWYQTVRILVDIFESLTLYVDNATSCTISLALTFFTCLDVLIYVKHLQRLLKQTIRELHLEWRHCIMKEGSTGSRWPR